MVGFETATVTQGAGGQYRRFATSADIVDACMRYASDVGYRDVTLAALSSVSAASERRVRDAFYECQGSSPTAYLRACALREVRRMLLEHPDGRDVVTRTASDFGFWHLSRFATRYRALFGESPSETVFRARRLALQDAPHSEALLSVHS